MHTTPPFPPELWEQTPLAVREYIRTLEARVAELEATIQRLLERRQQDLHNSSRPPLSDPPCPEATLPPYAAWTEARGTTRAFRPESGVGATRGRGCSLPRQTHTLCALPAPFARC